jgi:hypothetical protein
LDHRHSIETHAAERYLLGELTAVEAEAFELHYFDCPQCALAVESGEMFISSVRETAREGFPAPVSIASRGRKSSFLDLLQAFWRQPAFGFAIAAGLALALLYQSFWVIPGMKRPRALPAFHLVGATRAEDQKILVSNGEPTVEFNFDIPPEEHSHTYSCSLSAGEKTYPAFECPPQEEGQPVTIQVPAGELRAGRNELTVRAESADGKVIQTYPFEFRTR